MKKIEFTAWLATLLSVTFVGAAYAGGFQRVPEPTTGVLVAVGAAGLAWWARRRR